jgi:hypothetical protein
MMLSNLQDFGEGKFRRIVELLKRGAPSTLIVQLIQEQWGDCCDLPPDILAKELEWLSTALTISSETPEQFTAEDNAATKVLRSSGHDCLNELVKLALDHAGRVTAQLQREESIGRTFPETNRMIELHAKLLGAIQGMKFDLGIDTYMRRMPQDVRQMLKCQEREKQEDERRVVEAYTAAEEVFERLSCRRHQLRRDPADAGTNANQPSRN